ncbi:hypothetical protein T07_12259 [Trichinella nelsoni]|uniref:Uncharacterized protein n=1 Tax=Trichinella nelsoni TaxID=6336 RepID=A0A0V0RUX9_9BILA|nr:hypothetical protein T07_12259 [Trichinella nelsoni]
MEASTVGEGQYFVTEVDKAYLMHDWIDLFTIGSAAASSPPSSLLLQEENKLSSQKLQDNHADSANLCQYFFWFICFKVRSYVGVLHFV